VTLVGACRSDLEVAAKELDVDAIVCDITDPASLEDARGLFPHHLDTIVNVPAPSWDAGDPRTYSIADTAKAWRSTLDATVLSAVLTLQTVGDHLRSGGSIISVVPENPPAGSADAAIKATLSSWVAGQATVFGTRGITVNAVASGRSVHAGYEGLSRTPPSVAAEVARLALFLTTSAARPHHRPNAACQPRRAGAFRLKRNLFGVPLSEPDGYVRQRGYSTRFADSQLLLRHRGGAASSPPSSPKPKRPGDDSVFVMDHFYQLPMLGTPDQPMLEAYTALGALRHRDRTGAAGHAGDREYVSESDAAGQDHHHSGRGEPGPGDSGHWHRLVRTRARSAWLRLRHLH